MLIQKINNLDNKKLSLRAHPRWIQNEIKQVKEYYLKEIQNNKKPKEIYQSLANNLGKSYLSVKQKLERLRNTDEELQKYMYKHWTRDDIVEELIEKYVSGSSLNRQYLPIDLRSQIAIHSIGNDKWFESFDHAIVEALLKVGNKRDDEGKMIKETFKNFKDAHDYYLRNLKKTHKWTAQELIDLFQEAYDANLPLTRNFFAKNFDLYKIKLGINRSLEGLRSSVPRCFGSWSNIFKILGIAGEGFYDENGEFKLSTEEGIVAGFLDKNNIPYRRGSVNEKIIIDDEDLKELGYKSFIPDFYILDKKGEIKGIIEVFGSIANNSQIIKENKTLGELYSEKREAKIKFFTNKFGKNFIYFDNSYIDKNLDEESLKEKISFFYKKS